MKRGIKWLLIGMIVTGLATASARATLLTFDNLTAGNPTEIYYPPVPSGYGGLNWNNFGVAASSDFPGCGYSSGVVSPGNEIFNEFGNPASVSLSNGFFDLYSAYLTAALNLSTPLNVQVEGFDGTKMVYDNTYTVYNTGPTLINFDYTGVNQVVFISSPSQQFVLDNMSVNVPDPLNTLALFGATTAGLLILRRKIPNPTA